jgi:hypothetical protein
MRTSFNQTERDLLTKNGWQVGDAVAGKNYHEIIKRSDTEIEVQVAVINDDEINDYWEWDSSWTTVERAIQYCKDRT